MTSTQHPESCSHPPADVAKLSRPYTKKGVEYVAYCERCLCDIDHLPDVAAAPDAEGGPRE